MPIKVLIRAELLGALLSEASELTLAVSKHLIKLDVVSFELSIFLLVL